MQKAINGNAECSTPGCDRDPGENSACGTCRGKRRRLRDKKGRVKCAEDECETIALPDEEHCRSCGNRLRRRAKLIALGQDPDRDKICAVCKVPVPVLNFPVNKGAKDCSGLICYACQASKTRKSHADKPPLEPKEIFGNSSVYLRMNSMSLL